MKKILLAALTLGLLAFPIVAIATAPEVPEPEQSGPIQIARRGDAADGLKIKFGKNDSIYPAELYAESAYFEIFASGTAATFTMGDAGDPDPVVIGNTAGGGGDLAASVTANGFTVDLAAGTATSTFAGVFRCHATGRVKGEEDEDVTLAWTKDGSAVGAKATLVIEYDASSGVAELSQPVSMQFTDSFDAGDVLRLTVDGSQSEVIEISNFTFGCHQIKSGTF